jgi:hypothetical protein
VDLEHELVAFVGRCMKHLVKREAGIEVQDVDVSKSPAQRRSKKRKER